MRKLIVFAFAAVVSVSTVFAGNTNPNNKKSTDEVTKQVAHLLEAPEFEVTSEITAMVTLVVNSNQEVIVLDVETDNEEAASFIKSRLNYEKLNIGETGEQVLLPVRIMPAD